MDASDVGTFFGALMCVGGLYSLKRAGKEFLENKNVGSKEKLFIGLMNFFAAFGGRGDSFVFLGLFLCTIGGILLYYNLGGF